MLRWAARVVAFLASYSGTSSDGRPAGGASTAASPVSPGSSSRSSAAASGSTPPAALDRPASALAEPTAAAEQPTRAAAQESPVPSSRAAAPAATPARTGSARRDTQATKAISPPSTTTRAPKPTELDDPESRGRVCEPYGLSAILQAISRLYWDVYQRVLGGVLVFARARELSTAQIHSSV